MIGETISHYRIIEKLGEGGMGVVYRAKDAKLGRDVAIKVLPPTLAGNAERMARFQREAQVLASLNHPHIAAIYGLEKSNGVHALVMELIKGPTLADRISEGPIPLEEALGLARQLADALEYAHDRGIIHRDLKPANIKLTEDGAVKVLDFGLAKPMTEEPEASNPEQSPTLTFGATEADVILGTAGYMAPEQARGKRVDKRADIWAFGVVLYEMLMAKRLFDGEDVTETLASVVKDQPDLSEAPPKVRRLLSRCLEKDPKKRLRDISVAWELIEQEPQPVGPSSEKTRFGWLSWALAGVLAVIAVALALVHFLNSPPEPMLRKSEIPVEFDWRRFGLRFVISPDGGKIAYLSGDRLWIRDLGEFESREIVGSDGAQAPFWSPDGGDVAYFVGSEIWRVPASGLGARRLGSVPEEVTPGAGGAWTGDGTLLFTTGSSGLWRIPETGGDPVSFVRIDPETKEDFHQASALPEGGALFVVHRKVGTDSLAVSDGTGHKIILTVEGESLGDPVYSTTGHVLYEQAGTNAGIWALPFSVSRMAATGEPFLAYPGATAPSVSREGTLAIVRLPPGAALSRLVWIDRNGERSGDTGIVGERIAYPAISPDGRQIAYRRGLTGEPRLWVYDTVREVPTLLSARGGLRPAWSPRGDQAAISLAFNTTLDIFVRRVDGTGEEQPAVTTPRPDVISDWSMDDRYLLYFSLRENNSRETAAAGQTGADLWFVERTDDGGWGEPQILLQEPFDQRAPTLSPDGGYFAYESDHESGRP